MKTPVGRNHPCPCGSGRKYKHCCAGRQQFTKRKVAGTRVWVILAIVVATIAIVAIVYRTGNRGAPGTTPLTPHGVKGGPTPEPWTYDSVTNRHYDPTHGHWHDGQPPPPSARSTARIPAPTTPPGPTPAPWTYDAVNNQHWDPNHGHWHSGPPPQGTR